MDIIMNPEAAIYDVKVLLNKRMIGTITVKAYSKEMAEKQVQNLLTFSSSKAYKQAEEKIN